MPTTLLELDREPKSVSVPAYPTVPEEWTTGVELSPVPGITYLIRCIRSIPESRTAVRYGTETLGYGELFRMLAQPQLVPAGTPVERLVRLLGGLLGDSAGRGLSADRARGTLRLSMNALAVAVADRRSVAAERRSARIDRALGTADVRLLASESSAAVTAVELLSTLADGAALAVADRFGHPAPEALVDLIERHGVTHVTGSAAAVAGISAAAGALPSVCRWDITGTAADPGLPDRLRELAPHSLATFGFTTPGYAGVVTRGCFDGTGRTRPIPGARVQVLDADLRPVGPGVYGDVYVGGAALGSAATQEMFVPDPAQPGLRLLHTGERAAWTAAGWLVFA